MDNKWIGAGSSVIWLEMLGGREAGMESKRLAVTDDHTDLRIF